MRVAIIAQVVRAPFMRRQGVLRGEPATAAFRSVSYGTREGGSQTDETAVPAPAARGPLLLQSCECVEERLRGVAGGHAEGTVSSFPPSREGARAAGREKTECRGCGCKGGDSGPAAANRGPPGEVRRLATMSAEALFPASRAPALAAVHGAGAILPIGGTPGDWARFPLGIDLEEIRSRPSNAARFGFLDQVLEDR